MCTYVESMLGELNSMTRLIISLGLVGLTHDDTVLVTQNVYFVYIGNDHLPKVESNSMKLGGDADSINRVNSPVAVMPLHDLKFRKCQVRSRIYMYILINN